jgi:hypothetical protein
MQLRNFVGPSYTSQSRNADAERLVNWYPEVIESDGGKARVVYYPCPGKEQFISVPSATRGVRALFAEDGRVFAVIGNQFVELFVDRSSIIRGSVLDDGGVATISSSGLWGGQLFITSAFEGYIYDLVVNTLTPITDDGFPHGRAVMGLFTDGYFIVLAKADPAGPIVGTYFQISELQSGLSWNDTQFGRKVDTSDPLVAIVVVRRELWLMGEKTIEVWYNAGTANFPFAPFPGKVMNVGCEAPFSVVVVDSDQILFVGARNGCGMVYQIADSPQRVSTHYIERMLQSYPTTNDAVAYSYQEEGHVFYVVSFPTANQTWAFDVLTGLWHERGSYHEDTGSLDASRVLHHCFAFEQHLVGDLRVGTVYRQAVTIPTEDGSRIVRVRRAPHVSEEQKWFFYQGAQLDLETGLAFPSGTHSHPDIMLRWSDDGGHVWSPYISATAGLQGQYRMRAMWQRLGRSRDRVFEISVSDPIPWRVLDFYLTLATGTS